MDKEKKEAAVSAQPQTTVPVTGFSFFGGIRIERTCTYGIEPGKTSCQLSESTMDKEAAELAQILSHVFPTLDDEHLREIKIELQKLGCDEVEDLQHATEDDLHFLKPLQRRKLLAAISERSWEDIFQGRNLFYLVIEGSVVNDRISTFREAVISLFSCFYTLSLEYPPEAAVTMEFIQRELISINPEGPVVTKSGGKKKKKSTVAPKIVALLRGIMEFESDWHID